MNLDRLCPEGDFDLSRGRPEDELSVHEERDEQTYAIIGAAMAVHRELGCGFLEAVYQEALAIELKLRGIPFHRERKVPVFFKGFKLNTFYRPDFLCYEEVVVELKALTRMSGTEEAQVINALKATELNKGLLINFGRRSLEYQRFAHGET